MKRNLRVSAPAPKSSSSTASPPDDSYEALLDSIVTTTEEAIEEKSSAVLPKSSSSVSAVNKRKQANPRKRKATVLYPQAPLENSSTAKDIEALPDDSQTQSQPPVLKKSKTSSNSESSPAASTSENSSSNGLSSYHQNYISRVLPSLLQSSQEKEDSLLSKPSTIYDINELDTKYGDVFRGESIRKAAYLLPVFHFLGKSKIIVTQYNTFQGKLHVRTKEPSVLVDKILKHGDLSEEQKQCLISRFKRSEWFKIPLNDEVFIRRACEKGHNGKVEIYLKNVKETFMHDPTTFEKIPLLVPELRYQPVATPAPKNSKSSATSTVSPAPMESGYIPKGEEGSGLVSSSEHESNSSKNQENDMDEESSSSSDSEPENVHGGLFLSANGLPDPKEKQ